MVSFGAVAAMAKALADLQKKDAPGTRLLFAEVGVPNLFRARTDEFFCGFFFMMPEEKGALLARPNGLHCCGTLGTPAARVECCTGCIGG